MKYELYKCVKRNMNYMLKKYELYKCLKWNMNYINVS